MYAHGKLLTVPQKLLLSMCCVLMLLIPILSNVLFSVVKYFSIQSFYRRINCNCFYIDHYTHKLSLCLTSHRNDLHFIVRSRPTPGPSRTTARGPGKHFRGAPLGRKFLNFSFQNGTFWRSISSRRWGPQTSRGPG